MVRGLSAGDQVVAAESSCSVIVVTFAVARTRLQRVGGWLRCLYLVYLRPCFISLRVDRTAKRSVRHACTRKEIIWVVADHNFTAQRRGVRVHAPGIERE